jgi:hypothetical protein
VNSLHAKTRSREETERGARSEEQGARSKTFFFFLLAASLNRCLLIAWLSIVSKPPNQIVILLESTDRFHRGLKQDPTENKDSYRESDLPCPRRLWTQPDQGQRQGAHTTDCDDNKGFLEIPGDLLLCKARVVGGIDKLAAVFALYRVVLNFFSAEGTLFHYHLFQWNGTPQANSLSKNIF